MRLDVLQDGGFQLQHRQAVVVLHGLWPTLIAHGIHGGQQGQHLGGAAQRGAFLLGELQAIAGGEAVDVGFVHGIGP
ncbi:MAG: hypothetical protein IPH00_17025 [Flavobacteriales bacterium]|nr:hypothetical protein [Flavobacteriales bacterium]